MSGSLAILVTVRVVVATVPGVVAAETRTGESAAVAEGETVDGLEAFAGSVVVRGTVEGDLAGAAGDVPIAETGTVGGTVEAGAGTVRIDGAVRGDVTVGADTIVLGENASLGGDRTYDGQLRGDRDAVAGSIERDPSLGDVVVPEVPAVADWAFEFYGLLANRALGATLLLAFPTSSRRVADRASGRRPCGRRRVVDARSSLRWPDSVSAVFGGRSRVSARTGGGSRPPYDRTPFRRLLRFPRRYPVEKRSRENPSTRSGSGLIPARGPSPFGDRIRPPVGSLYGRIGVIASTPR